MNYLLLSLGMMLGGSEKLEGLQKEFEPVEPAFKAKAEKLNPTVKIDKDSITVGNRGAAKTKKEYAKNGGTVTITFKVKWLKGEGNLSDHPSVIWRTDGKQRPQWSHEPENGVMLRIVPNDGQLHLNQVLGNVHDRLGTANVGQIKKGEEYSVRLVDDGQRVDVYWQDGKEPVLTKNAPPFLDQASRKVMFTNREPVSGDEKEAVFSGIKIEVKK